MNEETCTLCTSGAFDLEYHYHRKHDVSKTERHLFTLTIETIEVNGHDFEVLRRNSAVRERRRINYGNIVYRDNLPYYYCTVCRNEGYRDVIEEHLFLYHIQTHEERTRARKKRKKELTGPRSYCDICWEFASSWHYSSDYHKKKEEYIRGTGCDICRTTVNPLKNHYKSLKHEKSLNYRIGSGCDICKKIMNGNELEEHNREYKNKHEIIQNYVIDSGCNTCKLYIPSHENSNRHKISLRKQNRILDNMSDFNFSKVKSARF